MGDGTGDGRWVMGWPMDDGPWDGEWAKVWIGWVIDEHR
jgi:hypothetical protein